MTSRRNLFARLIGMFRSSNRARCAVAGCTEPGLWSAPDAAAGGLCDTHREAL